MSRISRLICNGHRHGLCASLRNGARKVGLVWAGRLTHLNDKVRSIPVETFAPLLDIPGVSFFSLQKGEVAAQLNASPGSDRVLDFMCTV